MTYLNDKQVAEMFGVSRQSIWRWMKFDITFPRPYRFSSGCTRWNRPEIEAWQKQRRPKKQRPLAA